MSEPFGMHVQFTAQPGQADELEAILLEAAEGMQADDACRLYLISRSPESADTVLVTEAWTSREAHDQSVEEPQVKALIQRAMPLLAGPPGATQLRPSGGKGI